MRSQKKWWFFSEADEEQPGTDRDVDYYQYISNESGGTLPPTLGWVKCRNGGADPPPMLKPVGRMVPRGEEFNTLEHQLAQWAVENKIIEFVLEDVANPRIVARSIPLVKFLASMSEHDDGVENTGEKSPNAYGLRTSHLLFMWETYSKDKSSCVIVSDAACRLLISILPYCPNKITIQFLKAIRSSLPKRNDDDKHYVHKLAEFCIALLKSARVAVGNEDLHVVEDLTNIKIPYYVEIEVRQLIEYIIDYPNSSSFIISYDTLKQYVTANKRMRIE